MKLSKDNWRRVTVYVLIIVILFLLASIFFQAADTRMVVPLEENYHVSVLKNHNNSIGFAGGSVSVNLTAPANITTAIYNFNGFSTESTSQLPLTVASITANSAPGTTLGIYLNSNMTLSAKNGYNNTNSTSLETLGEANPNYVDAFAYKSGRLNVSESDSNFPVKGAFEYNRNYSEQSNESHSMYSYNVLSKYYLILNETSGQDIYQPKYYFSLELTGGNSNGLFSTFVMNSTNGSSFSLILDGNNTGYKNLGNGAFFITGFQSLTVDFTSYDSLTELPYDFISGIQIPYTQIPQPTVDINSSNISLVNSSGFSKLLNGNLFLSSTGGFSIQLSPYQTSWTVVNVGVYVTAQTASAALNYSSISQISVLRNPGQTIFDSAIAGTFVAAAIAMILDPVRDRIWPKK